MPHGPFRDLCRRLALTGLLAAMPALAAADQPPANLSAKVQSEAPVALPSLSPLVERVLPAVVNVSVELKQQAAADEPNGQMPFDQFLKRFFENPSSPGAPNLGENGEKIMAVGSGFIIDPTGYIVTNNHVVGNAERVTVIFQDGSRHRARIVGRDDKTDVALLKIDTDRKLPFVDWGDSREAKVGDWVVAVGNPFGLGGTVTAGIISALGRNISDGPYDDFLQIDAPINRGNSGGPTFDLSGHVIGINTAIYSPSGGSVGIGFAIPSNLARNVVEQLKANGHATWAWLGVEVQEMSPSIAKSLGLDPENPQGALVASVMPDSPAQKAGLKSGDVILRAAGNDIKTVHDLPRIVAATPIGHSLDLTLLRDGKQMQLSATVAELPKKMQTAAAEPRHNTPPAGGASALGLTLAPLDADTRSQLQVPKDITGVIVARVAEDSPAGALGMQPGDVIQSIDRKPATTPEAAARQLKEAAAKGNILLLLNRHGLSEFVGLSMHGPMSGD